MLFNKLLKNFFTANIAYSDAVSYRRIIMINSMLSLSILVFLIFTYINIAHTQDYIIATFDFLTALASIFALMTLRKDKNVKQAAFISVVILIIFMISFTIKNQNSHFGIIWSIFIPYFAILFNGKRVGLMLSVFFYTVMFYLSYTGIGVWNEGAWSIVDFIRFAISAIVLTYIIYMIESAQESADAELKKVRKHEGKIVKELNTKAITDGLTGVYNRRHFHELLPRLIQKVKEEEKECLSLFILDIDYFKNYNDYYGHQKGDEALKKVAHELKSLIQKDHDCVFRIGGEEFAGFMHIVNKDESEDLISQINEKINALNIEHEATKLDKNILTVSIGVCITKVSPDIDLEYLYKKADDALYEAKESGRDRTVRAK